MLFTFAEALTALKMGFKMTRKSWKDGYYIQLQDDVIVVIDSTLGTVERWDTEHRHLLAHDWCKHFEAEVN